MVAPNNRAFFTFDSKVADRFKRLAYRLSAQEGRRITYKDLLGRALDALERELKAPATGKRKK